jgi:predicted ArsR family transcriptional regulator
MLEPLLNSQNKEQALVFLLAREEGYATEIARFFDTHLYGIQKQLDNLEAGGILVSRKVGRTRLYTYNPRYALVEELKSLIEKALSFYPDDLQEALLMDRRRPRLRGKSR